MGCMTMATVELVSDTLLSDLKNNLDIHLSSVTRLHSKWFKLVINTESTERLSAEEIELRKESLNGYRVSEVFLRGIYLKKELVTLLSALDIWRLSLDNVVVMVPIPHSYDQMIFRNLSYTKDAANVIQRKRESLILHGSSFNIKLFAPRFFQPTVIQLKEEGYVFREKEISRLFKAFDYCSSIKKVCMELSGTSGSTTGIRYIPYKEQNDKSFNFDIMMNPNSNSMYNSLLLFNKNFKSNMVVTVKFSRCSVNLFKSMYRQFIKDSSSARFDVRGFNRSLLLRDILYTEILDKK